jgi:hypothetical protein
MKVVLVSYFNSSNSFLDYDDSEVESSCISSTYSLQIFGKSIIARNIEILDSLYDIEKIVLPKKLKFLTSIIISPMVGRLRRLTIKCMES